MKKKICFAASSGGHFEQLMMLRPLMEKYDSFIIMGHSDPDLDSLGSALGLCEIIEYFGKKAYLFLDTKKPLS